MKFYLKRAETYLNLKMFPECIADCDAARILNPSNLQTYLMSAGALIETHQFNEALKLVETAK